MKLLLDQNLSRRLLPEIEPAFAGSTQVALCGLDTASDLALWDFARENGFCIVTKDADFVELSAVFGFPPKVLRLNLGNVSNQRVREVLLAQREAVSAFLIDAAAGVLEID